MEWLLVEVEIKKLELRLVNAEKGGLEIGLEEVGMRGMDSVGVGEGEPVELSRLYLLVGGHDDGGRGWVVMGILESCSV